VDVTNNIILGIGEYMGKVPPHIYVTIPPGATWYHQLTGVLTVVPGDYTKFTPIVELNINDVNRTYPVILSADNFENLRNHSPYRALEYVDYVTNASSIIDGSKPISPQFMDNGTATWIGNVSIRHELPIDDKYFEPRYYYIIIENKNMYSEIPIEFVSGF
jgi:hypothetical protein